SVRSRGLDGSAWCAASKPQETLRVPRNGNIPRGNGARLPTRNRCQHGQRARLVPAPRDRCDAPRLRPKAVEFGVRRRCQTSVPYLLRLGVALAISDESPVNTRLEPRPHFRMSKDVEFIVLNSLQNQLRDIARRHPVANELCKLL